MENKIHSRNQRGANVKILEKWLRLLVNDKQSKTAGVSYRDGTFSIRISYYLEHMSDGIDAKAENPVLEEAAKSAIIQLNKNLWKSIVRRSKNPQLNELKNEAKDLLLKELRLCHQREFAYITFLNEPEIRDAIFKNNDLLELQKDS